MASEHLQFQREYQQQKMPFKPGHVKSKLVMLGILAIFGYVGIWNFWPASTLANLPYCVTNAFTPHPEVTGSTETVLGGVFRSESRVGGKYFYLRFYPDGTVIILRWINWRDYPFARLDFGMEPEWRDISHRLNKENKNPEHESGKYLIQNNRIMFTTSYYRSPGNDFVNVEWEGDYSTDVLILLRREKHSDDTWIEKNEYIRLNVEQCPFTK